MVEQRSNPVQQQTLILFKGHPATGKSTLANALARHLAWPLVDKDDIKDHTYPLPNGGHLSYEIMWQIVRHQLEIGLSVLVDSPLSYPSTYTKGMELADTFGAQLLVIETRLDEAIWKARLESRSSENQPHRIASWAQMQQLLNDYNASWQYPIAPEHHLIVDTSQPLDQLLQSITKSIDTRLGKQA